MRVSQKLEYARRAMAQLAKHSDAQTITRLEEIAQREDMSANFLVQILNDLRRAGLVVSKRGKLGGYFLGRSADDITLYDIVEAVEPSILTPALSSQGDSGESVNQAWQTVATTVHKALKDVTLKKLSGQGQDPMFYI